MRTWILLASLLATFLAGCSDGGGQTTGEDPFSDFDDVEVDSGRGVIRGVVIDAMVMPIEGATIEVIDTQLSATTNANGAFLIPDVEPGTYFLSVSKAGYSTVQSSAEVKAGVADPPAVRIQIAPIPGLEPRYVPVEWQGHLGCSMRYYIEGRTCPGAEMVWPNHDFLVDIELDAVPTFVTSDMVWTSTQQLGGEMSFNLRRPDTNADTTDIEGRSPLHLFLNETTIAEHSNGARGGFGPDVPLRVIVFTAHLEETEVPGCVPGTPATNPICWGLGVQIDQPFNTYTHVFYNYEPPAEWRFTDDPDVPAAP